MQKPVVVRALTAFFRGLVSLLPRDLRAEQGDSITEHFEIEAATLHATHGARAVVSYFVRSLVDLLIRLPAERRYELRRAASRDIHSTYIPAGERMLRFVNDLRVAARTLTRRPGFGLVVTLTLALGIGANMAIFAVVDAVLIRPLPYPESGRIVSIQHHAPGLDLPELENSPGSILNYSRNARSFSAIAATDHGTRNLHGSGEPAQLKVGRVTASIFDVLRVEPMIGRRFTDEDTVQGAPRVVILTYPGWTKHFGSDRNVVGRAVRIDGVSTEIVGVMPRGFAYPDEEAAALLPMPIDYSLGYGNFGLEVIARLAPGVTLDVARQEVVDLQKRIPELDPELNAEFLEKAGWSSTVETLRDRMVKDAQKTLWIVLGTVGFLLLVACASVANLFLVRAESRRREVGVRFALGATRGRVASSFIAESLILGLAGGAWGTLLAFGAVRALVHAAPPELPRIGEVGIDMRVVLFGAAVSVMAGILFGILPLPHRINRPLADIVRGGRGQTDGRDRQTLRKTLIVAQIALALMLLVGSGLLLRSFQRLTAIDAGIEPDGVLTVGISLGTTKDRQLAASTYTRMIDEVAGLAGVTSVAATNSLPIDPSGLNGGSFTSKSRPRADGELPPVAMYAAVSDKYFATLGTAILQGRDIERADIDHARKVAVVSETFSKSFFDGKALGEDIRFGEDSAWITIVGIVKDVRTFGLQEEIKPMAYLPLSIHMSGAQLEQANIVVKTGGDPAALIPAVRQAVKRIQPSAPITSSRTMNEVMKTSTAETSLTMTILAIAATVAMLLGSVGLYGVIGYVVTQRTKEIGVLIALGAMPVRVGQMVLRQGLALALLGTTAGLGGAWALSRLLDSVLYEIDPRDPLTFTVVPVVLLAVTGIAAWLPARRAAAISPLEALRSD